MNGAFRPAICDLVSRKLSAEETDSAITVVAQNAFISKWVRDRYLSTIDLLATAYFPQPRTIPVDGRRNCG